MFSRKNILNSPIHKLWSLFFIRISNQPYRLLCSRQPPRSTFFVINQTLFLPLRSINQRIEGEVRFSWFYHPPQCFCLGSLPFHFRVLHFRVEESNKRFMMIFWPWWKNLPLWSQQSDLLLAFSCSFCKLLIFSGWWLLQKWKKWWESIDRSTQSIFFDCYIFHSLFGLMLLFVFDIHFGYFGPIPMFVHKSLKGQWL